MYDGRILARLSSVSQVIPCHLFLVHLPRAAAVAVLEAICLEPQLGKAPAVPAQPAKAFSS